MNNETIGFAKCVNRQAPTFPPRRKLYFDFSPWGGGFLQATGNGPGAVVLSSGVCGDIQTGRVYSDSRFSKQE